MGTNPGYYHTSIKSTKETAFQRAIILNEFSVIDGETIEWLDIELPVDQYRKARGHCLDLIGHSDSGYVICELKFGRTSAKNDPSHAAEQVKQYQTEILSNYDVLDEGGNLHHKNGNHFYWKDVAGTSRLIIAANEQYWEYWLKELKKERKKLPEGVKCYSLNVKTDWFEEQKEKSGCGTYSPSLPEDCVWTLVKQ